MQAWVVRGDGEPSDVFRLEDVPEPSVDLLANAGERAADLLTSTIREVAA